MKKELDISVDGDFFRWAFGAELTDHMFETALDLMNIWNNRHGKDLTLNRDGDIGYDFERMRIIWAHKGYPDGREMVI